MKKKIRFIICEGENAQTERNFLQGYQKDRKFIQQVNDHNPSIKNFLSLKQNKLLFKFKPIDYSRLQSLLDAGLQQSYLVIYVDNDNKEVVEKITRIFSNYKKANKSKKADIDFVHPSFNNAFEELLSFFFSKPLNTYKNGDLTNIKKELGEKYKSNPSIYEKVVNKGSRGNFLKNIEKYSDRLIFRVMRWNMKCT